MDKFDVIVVGAGLNGLAVALALGGRSCRTPLRVALIDRADPMAFPVAAHDSRCSALTFATQRMLQALGAWEAMAPHAQAMRNIIVTDAKDTAARKPLLSFLEPDEKAPATLVENQMIFKALLEQISLGPAITLMARTEISAVHFKPGLAHLAMVDGREIKANLVVGADGRGSPMRKAAGLAYEGWDYPQSAITLTIGHELPHSGRAEEHFHAHGVFAILPLSGNRSSLVWTETHERAKAICTLPDEAFLVELNQRFGHHRGGLSLLSPRHVYPLEMRLSSSFTADRLALIGDAAHALHPLAGLGLNMGFKDAAALADCVMQAAGLGSDIGAPSVLEAYAQWRRFDTYATATMLDGLNRLFANDVEALRQLRHFGLRLVDHMQPLKKALAHEASGITGDLPRLMRGLAA